MTAWSFAIGVIGTVLTLIGLWLTYEQARAAKKGAAEAKSAADAAKEAAQTATTAISQRVTIADLTAIRSGFQAVLSLLGVGKLELALYELRLARQRLTELRARKDFAAGTEIHLVVADLAQVQTIIENKHWGDDGDPLPMAAISELLSRQMDAISSWSENLRFTPSSGN